MNWRIKITASAREDIRNIKKWYATESVNALENFTKELVTVLESLQSDLKENRPSAKGNRKNSYDQCSVSYYS